MANNPVHVPLNSPIHHRIIRRLLARHHHRHHHIHIHHIITPSNRNPAPPPKHHIHHARLGLRVSHIALSLDRLSPLRQDPAIPSRQHNLRLVAQPRRRFHTLRPDRRAHRRALWRGVQWGFIDPEPRAHVAGS